MLLHAETAPLYLIHGGDGNRVAVLPYSDRFSDPGKQHTFIGLGLPHLIGAVGQHVIAGTGTARLVRGEGHNNVTHGVSLATHHHGVGRTINHLKGNPRKGGIALGCTPHLAVLLGNVNTAPDYLVFSFVLQHLSVLRNGDGDFFRKGLEHGVIGRDFSHGVVAVGQSVLPSGCHTRRVGGDGHGHLSRLGGGAVHHHGIPRVIDDLERNPLQAGIALGSGAGFAVQLLDGQPAPLDIFC